MKDSDIDELLKALSKVEDRHVVVDLKRAIEVQAVLRDALHRPDGRHLYYSTGCLHGDHDYCASMTGINGVKRPGRCKFCAEQCICPCHVHEGSG